MNYKKYFAQDIDTLARDLLGRLIVRQLESGLLAAQIIETGAYKGGVIQADHVVEARAGMLYKAGNVFLMDHRGHKLFNISQGSEACIELRKLRINGKTIDGPGAITNFLEAAELNNTPFGQNGLDIPDFKPSIHSKISRTTGNAPNCKGYYSLT